MRPLLLLPAACLIYGCASKSHIDKSALLPSSGDKNISQSFQLDETQLQTQTGLITLESGTSALLTRLWLFSHAQHTIDIQYYSVAKDVTGVIATDCLIRAADRGVKVRLLIDDAASKMYNRAVRLLDSHDNIEVRVYNAGLKLGSFGRRFPRMLKNGNRLLRRMHNKCALIDQLTCITGGRNIADEYYDYDHHYNFRDRDVLFCGKACEQASSAFEKFWNDELTVPYVKLSPKLNKRRYRRTGRFNDIHDNACDTMKFSWSMRRRVEEVPKELHQAQQSGEFIWVKDANFVSDEPGKNEDHHKREGGATTDSLSACLRSARKLVQIQSPYFVTTGPASDVIKETISKGVKYKLLTNSLASIDNFEAYGGYLKSRKKILDLGIDLYEFKPNSAEKQKLLNPETQGKTNYKAVFGLHSKTLLIDSSIAIIGSYNVDPRSANYNTECMLIVRSRDVVRNLQKRFDEEFLPQNSWKITKDFKPDKYAPLQKRLKAFFWLFIPKKLL